MATTIFIIMIIVILLLVKIIRDKKYLPGPWNLPVIGYLHKLDPTAPYLTLTELAQKYGPIYNIKLGMLNVAVLADARILKKVLAKDETLERSPLFLIDTAFEGRGLAHANIDLWKDQRKFAANFLRTVGAARVSPNRKTCESLIKKHVDEFVQIVKNQALGKPLDPSELIIHLISSTGSSLFLGQPFSLNDKKVSDLARNIHVFIKLLMIGTPLNFLPFLRFLPPYKKKLALLKQAVRTGRDIQGKLIHECEKSTNSRPNLLKAFQLHISESKSDQVYTLDQLHRLFFDLYIGFTETTITSLLWILLYLAQHVEVQTKIRQELFWVLQGESLELADFENLHYTKAALAEIARIRTVLPLGVPHYASENIYLDGLTIPKGTMIMPLLWGIHMDPKVHKDPEEFRPERFIDSDGKFFKPESFLPFQSGKRMCVGEDIANMVTTIFIAGVLQNFRIGAVDSVPIDFTGSCGAALTPKPQKLIFTKI
ncbi:hypothetical protein Zmor_022759 [Zophobas morio]|uniref:Cytochrome P450 n=1 Tax=Zophobas morio TaxID=2755281 RepID=A0AA38HY28_9CUCU|nr:hypothetical protein Zmor_022759 [Zophobas morio]